MAGKRKAYTPFSTSSEAGVSAAPVEGFIEVDQSVRPTVSTGFVDEKGIWQGNLTSDTAFTIHKDAEELANGASFLTPSANADGSWPLDMTGFNDIFIGIKPTNGGNYAIEAVMGPDSIAFANLSPINSAAILRGNISTASNHAAIENVIVDSADSLTADVWNIFIIGSRLKQQKLLQFKITNNSGDITTVETAFMRLV